MKHQSIACFTEALLVLTGLSISSTALAQQIANETIRPNKTVTYTISGEGDVDKVTGIEIQFGSKVASPPPDQQGFQTSFDPGVKTPRHGASGSLEVTLTIPASIVSGDYTIQRIIVSTANGASVSYTAPLDFTAPPALHIENTDHFRMRIKSVTENH
jgi:hypothetical protein